MPDISYVTRLDGKRVTLYSVRTQTRCSRCGGLEFYRVPGEIIRCKKCAPPEVFAEKICYPKETK